MENHLGELTTSHLFAVGVSMGSDWHDQKMIQTSHDDANALRCLDGFPQLR